MLSWPFTCYRKWLFLSENSKDIITSARLFDILSMAEPDITDGDNDDDDDIVNDENGSDDDEVCGMRYITLYSNVLLHFSIFFCVIIQLFVYLKLTVL